MLERELTIKELKIGDIVACEKQYMTSRGCYYPVTTGFRVKRKNCKSISLAILTQKDDEWIEDGTVRVPRIAIICSRFDTEPEPPLFARDNSRVIFRQPL